MCNICVVNRCIQPLNGKKRDERMKKEKEDKLEGKIANLRCFHDVNEKRGISRW